MKIALPLSLTPPSMGLRLSTVIDRCRLVSRSEYLISAGIRKNRPNGSIHPDSLTKKFVAARKFTGINLVITHRHFTRSLSGRLYKDAYGERFAQKLLGHTSENTTKLYLDERDNKAYVML
ncbi:integrase [Salmonella enterica subsp. enterica]|nr:integrase [Salmonella enterica subsp. enterica]